MDHYYRCVIPIAIGNRKNIKARKTEIKQDERRRKEGNVFCACTARLFWTHDTYFVASYSATCTHVDTSLLCFMRAVLLREHPSTFRISKKS